jgi:hypothetical protein
MSGLTLHTGQPVRITAQDIGSNLGKPFRVLEIEVDIGGDLPFRVSVCCPAGAVPVINLNAKSIQVNHAFAQVKEVSA